MRALIQRVTQGAVAIGGRESARIGRGYLIFLGIRKGDSPDDARALAEKCAALRIMEDAGGRMNLTLTETGGSALVVSEFTLYADTRRGHRPGFADAAPGEEARPLYDAFLARITELLGPGNVRSGEFRAMMSVTIENDGPVTVLIEFPHTIN